MMFRSSVSSISSKTSEVQTGMITSLHPQWRRKYKEQGIGRYCAIHHWNDRLAPVPYGKPCSAYSTEAIR
jgi:hypothetical protein